MIDSGREKHWGDRMVRGLIHAAVGLAMLAGPVAATAQTEIPPPIVQSLEGPETKPESSPWVGAIAGAAIAVVGVNAWTGGAMLAPAVGPALSGILGGYWLGAAAMPPLAAQAVFETTSLVTAGVSGSLVGYWLGGR